MASLSFTTACMADPPPPQLADWKEDLPQQGRDLGFEDPVQTGEFQQIEMKTEAADCVLTLTQLESTGAQVATLRSSATGKHVGFDDIPSREEMRAARAQLGCPDTE